MISYGGMNSAIGILALILLSMYISFFYGISGIFIKKALLTNRFSPLLIPFIWISKDIIIENLFGGFPWSFIGYSQYKNILFIQTAEIGGIHFITFLILLINLLIYLYIINKDHKIIIFLIMVIMFNYISGYFLLKNDKKINKKKKAISAGIIQPNTGQNFFSTIKWRKVTLEELLHDSGQLKNKGAEFVIWPEYTTSLYPLQNRANYNKIMDFVRENVPVFAGFTDFRNSKEIYNSIILFKKNGIEKYNKVRLVPYGEYILFKELLFFIKKITQEVSEFTPGKSIHNLTLKGINFAVPICYEIIYPGLVRKFIKKGGEVIVLVSNDSWYGTSSAPFQLLSMSVFRSIENRRYILRSTSNGISALIKPSGSVYKSVPLNKRENFIVSFKYRQKRTIFLKFGYLFPWFSLIFSILFFIYIKFRRKTGQ